MIIIKIQFIIFTIVFLLVGLFVANIYWIHFTCYRNKRRYCSQMPVLKQWKMGAFIAEIESRMDYYYYKNGLPNHARLDELNREVDDGLWDDYLCPVFVKKYIKRTKAKK